MANQAAMQSNQTKLLANQAKTHANQVVKTGFIGLQIMQIIKQVVLNCLARSSFLMALQDLGLQDAPEYDTDRFGHSEWQVDTPIYCHNIAIYMANYYGSVYDQIKP